MPSEHVNAYFISPKNFNNHKYRESTRFKGDLLEIASARFKSAEIKEDYNPKHLTYNIERNKIFYDKDGTKNKIDIWIEINT